MPPNKSNNPNGLLRQIELFNSGVRWLRSKHGRPTAQVTLTTEGYDVADLRNASRMSDQLLDLARERYMERARFEISTFMERIFRRGLVISEGAAEVRIHRSRQPVAALGYPNYRVTTADYSLYEEERDRYTLTQWAGQLPRLLSISRTVLASQNENGQYQAWGVSLARLTASINDQGESVQLFQYYVDHTPPTDDIGLAVNKLDDPPRRFRLASQMGHELLAATSEVDRLRHLPPTN